MLRPVIRSVLGKNFKGVRSKNSSYASRVLCSGSSSLKVDVHTASGADRKSFAAPTAQQTSYLNSIKNRGFYLDQIYQHTKSSVVKDLHIVEDGKKVQITWDDGHVSSFHSVWLRHNCHCETCLPHTTTVLVDFSKIDLDMKISSAHMDGDEVLVLRWESTTGELSHEGPILTKFLRYNCYSRSAEKERSEQRAMKFREEKIIPEVECEEIMQSDKGLYKWLMALSEIGICLVKNVPTNRGSIKPVAERIAQIQHTSYGDVFYVESSPKPMNAAYTGVGLSLHMDSIHYESPPGIQMLHCVQFDECIQGGENFFVDLHEVGHKMKKEHPELFDTLTRIPVAANTLDYNRDVPVHLRTMRPLINVNHKDEIISIFWQPMSIAPLQVAEEDVEPFYKAYKQLYTMVHYHDSQYTNRLQPGDMITFNNRRVLHGRKAYTENGTRILQGCYLNINEFQSKVMVFHNLYGDGRWPVRAGNVDFQ